MCLTSLGLMYAISKSRGIYHCSPLPVNELLFLRHPLLDLLQLPIDLLKGPRLPEGRIQKRSKVESVVVGGIGVAVQSGCESRHFMTVDSIEMEEALDLLGHLSRCVLRGVVVGSLNTVGTPIVNKPLEHAKGSQLVFLTQTSENC